MRFRNSMPAGIIVSAPGLIMRHLIPPTQKGREASPSTPVTASDCDPAATQLCYARPSCCDKPTNGIELTVFYSV